MAKLDPRKALGKGIHSLLPARSTSHSTTTTEVAISGAQIIPDPLKTIQGRLVQR